MTPWLLSAAGLVLLFAGGEMLVRGAAALARRLGVPPLLIGLTVVGFGTSAPELLVSLEAALRAQPDLAMGNVVGSNIANILLILGASALVHPILVPATGIRRDALAVLAATLLLPALALTGSIDAWQGGAMVALLAGYIAWSYRADLQARNGGAELHLHEADELGTTPLPAWRSLLHLALGLAGVLLGARLLVTGAVDLARAMGVSEAVIGLTLVAVGTSLPELATSMMAALRGHNDVAVGNVLGSNLFNILGILGVTAAVVPLPFNPRLLALDLWVMLAATLAMLALFLGGRGLSRPGGVVFLLLYAGYTGWLFAA